FEDLILAKPHTARRRRHHVPSILVGQALAEVWQHQLRKRHRVLRRGLLGAEYARRNSHQCPVRSTGRERSPGQGELCARSDMDSMRAILKPVQHYVVIAVLLHERTVDGLSAARGGNALRSPLEKQALVLAYGEDLGPRRFMAVIRDVKLGVVPV